MRDRGREFGATTGRPRRCGWFDAVMVKESILLNGISELAIMKLDVLDGLKTVEICTAYRYKGKLFKEMPRDPDALRHIRPVYKQMRGWGKPLEAVTCYKDLPLEARQYLSYLQDILRTKVSMVSVGSARKETIFI